MTKTEEQEILGSLQQGLSAVAESLRGVSAVDARRAPAEGRWSMLECMEHVALSEEFLLARVLEANPVEAPQINVEREARITARGEDRSHRAEAPEPVRPRAVFSDQQTALDHFQSSRSKTIQFVKEHGREDLRARVTAMPNFGSLNCHEVLLLMAAHPLRHALQIAEIKAQVGTH
jgi:hypothetical protein